MVHEAYEGLGNGKSSLIFGKTDGVNGSGDGRCVSRKQVLRHLLSCMLTAPGRSPVKVVGCLPPTFKATARRHCELRYSLIIPNVK